MSSNQHSILEKSKSEIAAEWYFLLQFPEDSYRSTVKTITIQKQIL